MRRNQPDNLNRTDVFAEELDAHHEVIKELKQSEEKRKASFRRNLPSLIWLITKDLFAFLIILAIFGFASTQFETIIFALLVLVYLSIEGFFSSYGYRTTQTQLGLVNELLQIKELLKYKENELEREKREKTHELYDKLERHVQIHSIFLLIFFLITLWNLITALLG